MIYHITDGIHQGSIEDMYMSFMTGQPIELWIDHVAYRCEIETMDVSFKRDECWLTVDSVFKSPKTPFQKAVIKAATKDPVLVKIDNIQKTW